MKQQEKTSTTISTTWEIYTYDVWGNADEGYDVNDVYPQGNIDLDLIVTHNNVGRGVNLEFDSATPSDEQIREVFGLKSTTAIDTDGDDCIIYVQRERDGYPIVEMPVIYVEVGGDPRGYVLRLHCPAIEKNTMGNESYGISVSG